MNWTNEALFCVKYLNDRGFFPLDTATVNAMLKNCQVQDYAFIKVEGDGFFETLAKKLRDMWPAGEKEGKYPWRDSVSNISKRLRTVWTIRHLENYSLDDCLRAARRYLSQYEDNVKYMQILKYFIMKQKSITDATGKITYINESKFADMLESQEKLIVPEDWEITTPLVEQGELV